MSLCKLLSGEEDFSGFKGNAQEIRRKEIGNKGINLKGLKMKGTKEASYSRTSYFGHNLVGNYSKNTSNCKSISYFSKGHSHILSSHRLDCDIVSARNKSARK